MNSAEEWAKQLACPEGVVGEQVALEMNRSNLTMIQTAISAIPKDNTENILEIGPGNGAHLPYFFSVLPQANYIGIERSSQMLACCNALNREKLNAYSADFVLSEDKHLPFPNERFHAIFTVNTLYFWSDPVAYLEECYRVLKKGACLLIAFGDKSYMEKLPFTPFGFTLYDTMDLQACMAKSSFKHCKFSTHSEHLLHRDGKSYVRTYHIATAIKTV
jgi:ubiquinone/menaquinone biosynthesis C-methylase UbiE